MTRQSKLIILAIYLILVAIFMVGYRANRAKKVKLLRSQIATVRNEQEKVRRGEAELAKLSKLFPSEVGTTVVVEELYRYARESGLKQHELATISEKKQASSRPGVVKTGSSLDATPIKISIIGSFRQIAEYIRLVQNMERFNRISEFKLTPDELGVKGTMTIELYSLAAK